MNKTTKIIIGVIIVVAVVAIGYFVSKVPKAPTEPVLTEPLRIGFIGPLSGDAAFIGEDMQRGINLATQGNLETQLYFEDSGGTAVGVVSAYNKLKLITQLDALIVAGTGLEAIIPLVENDRIVTILTVSSAAGLPQKGDYIFRYFTNAEHDAPVMAKYATEELGLKKFGVIYVQDQFGIDYARIFSDEVAKRNGKVQVLESYTYADFDFRTQITKIKGHDLDGIYLIGLDFQLVPLIKQIRNLGIDTQILSMGTIATKYSIEQAGDAMNGVYLTAFCTDGSPEEYVKMFQDAYSSYPGFFSEIGYDIVRMIQGTVQEATRGTKDIKEGLKRIKNFKGNVGDITTDKYGEMIIPMCPKKIVEGKIFNIVTQKYSNY